MARLGNFGNTIRFEIHGQGEKVLQPLDVQQNVEARWSEQERYGARPVAEFQGMNNDEITMTVKVSAFRGVKPSAMIRRIRNAIETGQLEYLIEGGKRSCQNRCYIQKMSIQKKRTMKNGQLAEADLQLTFREYI